MPTVIKFWKNQNYLTLIPLAIPLLAIGLTFPSLYFGEYCSRMLFKQRLGQYEKAVQMVNKRFNGEEISLDRKELPKQFRHLGNYIRGYKAESGDIAITFSWGRESFFLYSSDENVPKKIGNRKTKYYRIRRINKYWFKMFYI